MYVCMLKHVLTIMPLPQTYPPTFSHFFWTRLHVILVHPFVHQPISVQYQYMDWLQALYHQRPHPAEFVISSFFDLIWVPFCAKTVGHVSKRTNV